MLRHKHTFAGRTLLALSPKLAPDDPARAPEFMRASIRVSGPHSALTHSRSTAAAAPIEPTLLVQPTAMATVTSGQYTWRCGRVGKVWQGKYGQHDLWLLALAAWGKDTAEHDGGCSKLSCLGRCAPDNR